MLEKQGVGGIVPGEEDGAVLAARVDLAALELVGGCAACEVEGAAVGGLNVEGEGAQGLSVKLASPESGDLPDIVALLDEGADGVVADLERCCDRDAGGGEEGSGDESELHDEGWLLGGGGWLVK